MNIATGDRFGNLVVLKRCEKKNRGPRYRCACDCRGRVFVKGSKLRNGEITRCNRCSA